MYNDYSEGTPAKEYAGKLFESVKAEGAYPSQKMGNLGSCF